MKFACFAAALPTLNVDEIPPLTVAEFEDMARSETTPEEFQTLKSLPRLAVYASDLPNLPDVYRKIVDFETALRLAVARRRAEKLGVSADDLPPAPDCFAEIEPAVAAALEAPNPVERERVLDHLRWTKLDELELFHDFDLEHLCLYRVRLLICDKYRHHDDRTGQRNFENAAARISQAN